MVKITIDNVDYETEGLSDNGKAQLASLQFVDSHMRDIRNEIAIYETAKRGYISALKAEMENPETAE